MDTPATTISPLAKKLLIKPGTNWLFYNAPEHYMASIEPFPPGVKASFVAEGKFDGVQLFVKDSAELAATLKTIVPLTNDETIIWIAYPKKSSGIKSDLEMTKSWDAPAVYGLRPVTAAAINDTWTGIRLRRGEQTKVSEFCNEEIPKNDNSAFIDPVKRIITMPPDMHAVVTQSAAAMSFFESLSFTNKKEYVVWILSAKQEKTRNERLEKLTDKLLAGKKNPSEK